MKLLSLHVSRITSRVPRPPRRQAGSAVIIVMALLAIMLVYVAANLRTLSNLLRELRLLERQQTRRLQTSTPSTNPPPAVTISTNAVSWPATR